MKTFPIKLSDEQHSQLRSLAAMNGISIHQFILNHIFNLAVDHVRKTAFPPINGDPHVIPVSEGVPGVLHSVSGVPCSVCGESGEIRYECDMSSGKCKPYCFRCATGGNPKMKWKWDKLSVTDYYES